MILLVDWFGCFGFICGFCFNLFDLILMLINFRLALVFADLFVICLLIPTTFCLGLFGGWLLGFFFECWCWF